jgi:hypothetical protein
MNPHRAGIRSARDDGMIALSVEEEVFVDELASPRGSLP